MLNLEIFPAQRTKRNHIKHFKFLSYGQILEVGVERRLKLVTLSMRMPCALA